jgi:hypothetical protein
MYMSSRVRKLVKSPSAPLAVIAAATRSSDLTYQHQYVRRSGVATRFELKLKATFPLLTAPAFRPSGTILIPVHFVLTYKRGRYSSQNDMLDRGAHGRI